MFFVRTPLSLSLRVTRGARSSGRIFVGAKSAAGEKMRGRLLEAERRKCRRPTARERERERASGGRSGNKKSPRIRGALALRARSRIYIGERELPRLAHHPRERQPPCVAGGSNRRSPGPKKAKQRATPTDPHPVELISLALAHDKQHHT